MASKKIIPYVLIGGGLLAGAWASLSSNNTNNSGSGNTTLPVTTNNGNIFSNLSTEITNLIAAITGGISTVSSAVKSSGTFGSIQSVLVGGTYYTALLSQVNVKNLKAGDKIKVVSAAFNGQYTVKQMGNAWGALKDTLIVIDRPYAITSGAIAGTYQEI